MRWLDRIIQRVVDSDFFCKNKPELSREGKDALDWLLHRHPESFLDDDGEEILDLKFIPVRWLGEHVKGLTMGHTIFLNQDYMMSASTALMVWLLRHEIEHARAGLCGNLMKMLRLGAHERIDVEIAHPLMQEFIDEQMTKRRSTGDEFC